MKEPYTLPIEPAIVYYFDPEGSSPFANWFNGLDIAAAARVSAAVGRIGRSGSANIKGVGAGVLEYRIDSGPGYRLYFGRDGATIIIILAGGTKRRQQRDIETAKRRWIDYKARKAKRE